MNTESQCPCDLFVFPWTVANRPGLGSISYRVGDFAAFRHALLLPRPGEVELQRWQPSAEQDLALQMIEWWAYLADILTFYNERVANQAYLRTADLPESVNRLIRVLGYRPRPGIGANATLAALLNKPLPLRLPQGLQIQSKPGPGLPPQIFELDADTLIKPTEAVAVDAVPDPALLQTDAAGRPAVRLAGAVTNVNVGDELLLLEHGGDAWALATVSAVSTGKDAHGKPNTLIAFADKPALPGDPKVDDYRLLKSSQFARPWQTANRYVTLQENSVDLDSVVRTIKVGDPLLFEIPGGAPAPLLVKITDYTEVVWYVNADNVTRPDVSTAKVPIPIPHSRISFQPAQNSDWPLSQVEVRHGWQALGRLLAAPDATLNATRPTLLATPPTDLPPGNSLPLLIEDANGSGVRATGSRVGTPPVLQLDTLPDPLPELSPPLRVLYGLLTVSRGQTVAHEILGSGDATVAGQSFRLKKSPLTYLPGAALGTGQNYRSTLTVRIDGIAWQEAPSFYGQRPDARIFVTREDENNQTEVMFGDGINGARLSSGVDNVVASYRYGSGAQSPKAGSLNVIVQAQPNLKAIRNPVAASGGGDPDPPGQIRRYAPQSVLAFGRAISADDYASIAAQAPGVSRARSYWAWNPEQQRALVTIYVGDDAAAAVSARAALKQAADPNRPVAVKPAVPVPVSLSLSLRVDPRYEADAVLAQVQAALLDPETGLFGLSLRIGASLYDSQIHQACLQVPGALAVHGLQLRNVPALYRPFAATTEYHSPGVGGFFQLTADRLAITPEAAHAQ